MPTEELEDLEAALAQLRKARRSGAARVTVDGVEVTYKSDDELAAVEAALVHQIAVLTGTAVATARTYATKGLDAI